MGELVWLANLYSVGSAEPSQRAAPSLHPNPNTLLGEHITIRCGKGARGCR
eukprot:GDKH01014480.1.p1 GENE.GDKH01014480.1~~GDKH01014480.1.p1  ORF type:complete len:51 (-),score=3.09 GDKH01014480.1:106-258(-)